MTRTRACPNCGSMQEFRKLHDDEKAAVREAKGARHFVDDLWRCTAAGCRTYFRAGHLHDRGLLPEKFGNEKEEAAEK
ncbi:hypothetical protein ACWC09_19780 [Streptomyces sp. NPDC001617]